MTKRYKYNCYLSALLVFLALSTNAQYSEDDLLREAGDLFEQHRYAEAMPLYSQLLSLNPTKPSFNYLYGATALYGDASKKEEAIKYLRYASTKNGIDPMCHYFLGRAYHLNYQFADAVNSYQKYQELGDKKEVTSLNIDREIESCRNGQNLLSNIKDVVVLEKKQSQSDAFFRVYDLSDIGGKILVTPEELLSPLDIKNGHKSLIHFRGSGTEVYFSSYGKDGKNGLDIYRANVLPGGSFSEPERIEGFINTPFDEDYPFMHPDNKTFYFSSKGHSSMGGYDIFSSVYDKSINAFSQPENLDFAVNTPDDELLYIADSAKQMANFASARSSMQGQLHVYKVKVYSAPVDLTLVKGTFDNQVDSKDNLAKITVIDASTNLQVDVQYTDPVTGEYLLSFPRSGKFKFLVEASNSEQVHAGIVEIPSSSGVNAYLQEMDLIAAANIEKLLINNLFDQHYEGDIAELAQKLLKQKAALDVNFNVDDAPPIPTITEDEEQDVAIAAAIAGFGAGIKNEDVIAESVARSQTLIERQKDIEGLRLGAINTYFSKVAIAEEKTAKLEEVLAIAETQTGEARSKSMFEAGLAKMEADNAINEARNAKLLSESLTVLEAEVQETYDASVEQSTYLKEAIDSGDFETALNALKTEKAWLENNASSYTNYDVLDLTQASSIEARKEAQEFLDRASLLRADAEEVQSKLVTKRRQLDLAKGKKAKELAAEISLLETEEADLTQAADRAFDRAEAYQNTASDKKQQYDIAVNLTESFLDGSADLTIESDNQGADGTGLTAVSDRLAGIEIDNSAVEAYLQANPHALDGLESDMAAMEFKRTYLADNQDEELVDNSNFEESSLEVITEGLASNSGNGNTDIAENAESTNSDKSTDKEEQSAGAVNNDTNKSDVDSHSGNGVVSVPVVTPVVDPSEASDDKANQSSDELAMNDAPEENTVDSNAALSEPVLEDYAGLSTSEKISADQSAVQSAKDWLSIIDGSIADLKSNESSLNKDDREQLAQFEVLKAEKLKEIELRNERIADWQIASGITPENVPDLLAISKANEIAQADVAELDPAYVTRLETKIVDTYSDRRYLGRIQQLDRSYLSEMTVIEMSGKSNPEIAHDRIVENEAFIADLNQKINAPETSQDEKDMLVEVRRIKTLEIKQDRAIQAGEMQYIPRTTEGREGFTATEEMLAEEAPDEIDTSELQGLSPEMQADLSIAYSRDVILDDYASSMKAVENIEEELEMKQARVDLNNNYLSSLQSEIALYAAAVKSADREAPAAVTQRYEELLNERSTVIDEINTDKTHLAFAAALDKASGAEDEKAREVLAETWPERDYIAEIDSTYENDKAAILSKELDPATEKRALAMVNSKITQEIDIAIQNLTAELDAIPSDERRDEIQMEVQRLDAIATEKRKESEQLKAEAEEIRLTGFLAVEDTFEEDQANSDSGKEETQIPELQETTVDDTEAQPTDTVVDELPAQNAEQKPSEEVAIADQPKEEVVYPENTASSNPQKENTARTKPEESADIEEMRNNINTVPIEIKDLNYKSLNANIALNAAKPLIEENNANKAEASSLMEKYEASTNEAEKAHLSEEIENLQKEIEIADRQIVLELANSNPPEIEFYLKENAEMMKRIKNADVSSEIKADSENIETRTAIIAARLSDNNAKFDRGEITEIDRIESETTLLSDLAQLNEEVSALNQEVTIALDTTADSNNAEENSETTQEELYSEKVPASIQLMLRKPESLIADGGDEYVSPVLREAYEQMSEPQIAEHKADDRRLVVNTDFVEEDDQETQFEILENATEVDTRGLKLLAASPNQLNYLLAAIKADSLGQLEKEQADYANELMRMASEELTEVERLRKAVLVEKDKKVKSDLMARADKIELEAINHYERGAIAAKRAEEIRELRQEHEKELVVTAAEVTYEQKAELDAILSHETYRIVPSDLASNDSKPVGSKPTERVVDTPKSSTSKGETPYASTKEQYTGNWLELVEIVAEKEDFSDVSENMFIQVDAPVYSDRRPIPLNPEMPKGVIFQVQVGAFRKPIPQDLFAQFAPVMGTKLDNGITRYRAGIFTKHKDATAARDIIRANGYSDAFVVVYLDGEKLTGAQVQSILAQAKEASAKDVASNTGAVTPSGGNQENAEPVQANGDYYNDPEAAEAEQVEMTPGLFFTVQVGVYSKPVKLDALYNLTQLNSELTSSGVIRYTTGRFATIAEASSHKTIAREKGVSDAFVTAYYNGKRISLDAAVDILDEEGDAAISPSVNEVSSKAIQSNSNTDSDFQYVVIIGSFVGDIPQDLANIFLVRDDLEIRRIDGPGGSSIYLSEEFTSEDEAKTFLSLCKQAGIDSAMMGKMKDGNIVSMDEE